MMASLGSASSCSTVLVVVMYMFLLLIQVKFSGATVTVGASRQWADEGSENFVTCTPSALIRFLRWYKSNTNQEFTDAQQILQVFILTGVVTFDSSVNASHYSFDESASDYPLTVNNVGLNDEVSYWCEVELVSGPDQKGKTSFQVRRIPTSIGLKHVGSGTSYNYGDTAEVIVGENQFECSVPNIKPAAEFTWTLGSVPQPSTEREESNDDPRLLTSYSLSTVTVDADLNLTCSAQNKQDGTTTPDQTISIMLKTRADPCSGTPCLNGGTCSPTADDFKCTCTDAYTGALCADAITTTVGPPSTPKPTGTTDNTTTTTPQDTTTPTFTTSQETTMSPSGPTETTSDFSSTEPSTTINTVTGSINKTTTQMGSTEMTTDPTEMTTDPTEMTTDPTEMTNSTHITPSTTATTPETTTTGCTIPCHAGMPKRLSDGVIIGIVAGCLGGVAIIAVSSAAVWNYFKKTDVSPQTDQSKNGKNKRANGKAAGVADV